MYPRVPERNDSYDEQPEWWLLIYLLIAAFRQRTVNSYTLILLTGGGGKGVSRCNYHQRPAPSKPKPTKLQSSSMVEEEPDEDGLVKQQDRPDHPMQRWEDAGRVPRPLVTWTTTRRLHPIPPEHRNQSTCQRTWERCDHGLRATGILAIRKRRAGRRHRSAVPLDRWQVDAPAPVIFITNPPETKINS